MGQNKKMKLFTFLGNSIIFEEVQGYSIRSRMSGSSGLKTSYGSKTSYSYKPFGSTTSGSWSTGLRFGSSSPSKPWSTGTKFGSSLPTKPWSTGTKFGSSSPSKPWSTGTKFGSPPTSTTSLTNTKFGTSPFSKSWSGKKHGSPPTSTTSSTDKKFGPSPFSKSWLGNKFGRFSPSKSTSTDQKIETSGTSTAGSIPGKSTSSPSESVNDSSVTDNQNPAKPQTSNIDKFNAGLAGVNAAANIGSLGIGAATLVETRKLNEESQNHDREMSEKEKENQKELMDAKIEKDKEMMDANRESHEKIMEKQAEIYRDNLISEEEIAQKEDRRKGIEEICIHCNQKLFELNLKRMEAAENKCLEFNYDTELNQKCQQSFFANPESSKDIFEKVEDEECFKTGSDYYIKAQRFPQQCFRDEDQFYDLLDLACNFEKSSNIDQWCFLKSQKLNTNESNEVNNFDESEIHMPDNENKGAEQNTDVDQVTQIDVQSDQNEGLEATCTDCYEQLDWMVSSIDEKDADCQEISTNEDEYNLCKEYHIQMIFQDMGGQENDCLKTGSDFFKMAQSNTQECFGGEEHLIWTLDLACHYGNANNIDQWCSLQSEI